MTQQTRKGEFLFIAAIDCETTGVNVNAEDASEGHQAVSWGIVIANAKTLEQIEELYVEVKWNDAMKEKRVKDPNFGKKAESIHGLTMEYLDEHGISEEEAVVKIANVVLKYFGPENSIRCLGHNVHLFDYKFLISMLKRYGITIPLANRHIDTSSVGFVTLGAYTSDELFETMGFEKRGKHKAIDDVKMSLQSMKLIRKLWNSAVGLKASQS